VIELALNGRRRLARREVFSLITYDQPWGRLACRRDHSP
jgi:hypothetical protein